MSSFDVEHWNIAQIAFSVAYFNFTNLKEKNSKIVTPYTHFTSQELHKQMS